MTAKNKKPTTHETPTESGKAPQVKSKSSFDPTGFSFLTYPCFIVNEAHVITWANDAFLKLNNLKPSNVLGTMTCEEALGSHLCGTKDCPAAKASRIKKPAEAHVIRTGDSERISHFRASASPLGQGNGTLVTLQDITERKNLENRLHQLETDLGVIPTPIMEIDTTFSITYMNPSGAGLAGLTPEDVLGKKCYDLFKTPHCKTEKCACARAMKTDSVVSEQTIARPADGIIIPIKYTGAPIKDAKGNIKGALEYILDVTEENKQKQAADEKIENLNTIPTPIMAIDTDFSVTFMNPAGASVLGMTPEEVTGKKCYDLFKTPHCKTEKCACARAMRTDSVVTEQTIARPAEGVIVPIKYTGAPIKDAKGNIKGALEYILDVTEENKKQQLADEKIENLNTIPTPIMAIDMDFTVTFMNPAGASVLGMTPDEVTGKKCYDLFKTPHCKTEKCACARAMRTDSVVTEQTIARPAEGVIVPIKYTGAPIKDAKGNIKGALEYVLDVTEEVQQKQTANEKIDNLNAIPTPIMAIDTDFTVTYMNPTGASVVGMTPDKVTGKKCYDLFKTPHCKTEKCACSQAMKSDQIVSGETIARPADGVIIPIKYTGAPIKDAKGNVKGALEFVIDITEETRQRQDAFEKIENLNAIPAPIFSVDTDFAITYINPSGAAVLGLLPEEVLGRKCYDLMKTPHCRTERCACDRAMKSDAVISEETIARPGGTIMPIKYTGAPIKDAKGNIKGALEFIVDMTEEARQRQEANEKIENLNAIPTPIHAVDTQHTITYINPAGAALANLTVEEAIGKKCWELFNTERCRTEQCGVARAMQSDQAVLGQTVAHVRDKEVPVKATSVSIKDAKGNIKGGLEYMVDITVEAKVGMLISSASEEVTGLVQDSNSQMTQSSTSMNAMIESLEHEVALLDRSASTMQAMLASAEEMVDMARGASRITGQVASDAEQGKKAGTEAGKKLQSINDSMKSNNQMVVELVAQLEKISGFVDIIKDIASQTNLLAFNAAIEAARAGDAGRGFAVVADEVRKLAENSSKSAVDIATIVKRVENDSRGTIDAMKDGMTMLNEGVDVINTALDAMDQISSEITRVSGTVDALSDNAGGLREKGQDVMQHIEKVVLSSKENTHSSHSVKATISETVSALDRLMASSRSLEDAIGNL